MPDLFLLIAAVCVFAMTLAIFGWMRLMREAVEENHIRLNALERRIDMLEMARCDEPEDTETIDGGF